jgi:hypothetical protein
MKMREEKSKKKIIEKEAGDGAGITLPAFGRAEAILPSWLSSQNFFQGVGKVNEQMIILLAWERCLAATETDKSLGTSLGVSGR